MPSTLRAAFVAALAIACSCAAAQTPVPPEVTVQRIAPQLVAFAGSQSNFQNLVSGLAQGTQVQLVSVLPDGSAQIVTFVPSAALPPETIAPTLESVRQRFLRTVHVPVIPSAPLRPILRHDRSHREAGAHQASPKQFQFIHEVPSLTDSSSPRHYR